MCESETAIVETAVSDEHLDTIQTMRSMEGVHGPTYVQALPFGMLGVRVRYQGNEWSNWCTVVLNQRGIPVERACGDRSVQLFGDLREAMQLDRFVDPDEAPAATA